MTLATVLLLAAALCGIGVHGALSQQSFVMVLMGLELVLGGAILAVAGLWAFAAGFAPEGQVLAIVVLAVMALEMSLGFALVVALYRCRQADRTEDVDTLKG